MTGERILPWTYQSSSLASYRVRYGDHPVGEGEYVYRYDGIETVQTTVPSARWHPGDTFRVLDRIDHPEWTRVDEDGNAIDNPSLAGVTPPVAPPPAAFPPVAEAAVAPLLTIPAETAPVVVKRASPVPESAPGATTAPVEATVEAALKAPVKAPVNAATATGSADSVPSGSAPAPAA
ncbi:MAG: hypothetical protein EBQ56_00445 [Proteobacteria bacterium]|nr:hypothetical protein [Actinomycetota bacterium]NBY46248.1 hypothetical protein [Pseudomonadota bacterium]